MTFGARPAFYLGARLIQEGEMRLKNRKLTAVQVLALALLALATPAFAQVAQPSPNTRAKLTVLVSVLDRKLAVLEDGEVIATFSVAVGAEASPSPTGEFQIVSRVSNPTYYKPGTVIPNVKDNPLGTRWVGLSQKGYGIDVTNSPRSIGHVASHGCVRLRNRDMEKLFTLLRVGDVVQIHGERDDEVAQAFGEYEEVADAGTEQTSGQ